MLTSGDGGPSRTGEPAAVGSTDPTSAYPTYRELLQRRDAPPGSTWHLFPAHADRGMANLITPEAVQAALGSVKRGVAFGLDYPLDAFDPSVANRTPPRHVMVSTHRDQRDEYLDGFWPQATSQVDGLRHRRHHAHGFYNGVPDEDVVVGSPSIGVNCWADRPIVGRGMLIDVCGFRAANGRSIDHEAGEHLDVDLLDDTLAWQGSALRPGDCVLIRTGWTDWYLQQDRARREDICRTKVCTGMEQDDDTLAWLWDHRVGLAAADTFAFEALPARADSPFGGDTDAGMMHQDLIALLGLPLGELWRLSELAEDCAATGSYDSLLTVKPLNLTGGVGSPANAVAIR